MITNGDCTVFNRVYDKATRMDTWVATHLRGVFWEDCKAANVVKSGMRDADSVRIFIPFFVDAEGKIFEKSMGFQKNPKNHFTLRAEDKIVRGIVTYDGSITKLQDEFDDVMTITSVDTFDYGSDGMQHWEVSGK